MTAVKSSPKTFTEADVDRIVARRLARQPAPAGTEADRNEPAIGSAADNTLVTAITGTRRQFLEASRRRIAEEIDSGKVQAYALARLIGEMDRIDLELRTKTVDDELTEGDEVEDGPFDYNNL
ncbi:hypothetical protein H489_0108270 [Curtobacterium flaccumfaciens UCD-AKU]|uniref:hypothetical protein n=1 Tax=Curtobacterium flaccumfaciens TaxID=2035 RepID=UPI00037FF3E2|nr:hypothetical protein [Curtobacterium flaccumfaciens]EYT64803.1 hypothetical protein H489_0108270 [Curtobacterium flaccumfaciens UCD-AKU]